MMNKTVRCIGLVVTVTVFLFFLAPILVGGIFNLGNATGLLLSMIFLLYIVFMPRVHIWIKKQCENPRWKAAFTGLTISVLIILGLAGIETVCMINAATKTPAENATAIVLGCRVYGERPNLSLVERLEAAYIYLEENPEVVCIVSGGKGDSENISEAECMYRWLVDKGIDCSRIYKEENSTSTDENIAFSKEIIEEHGLNENIAIITSEYHTYRAGKIAEENGLSFGTVPGKTAIWLFPTFYVRELYAILAEWVF